jgi:RAB protein geranylgeranyltransferase component A
MESRDNLSVCFVLTPIFQQCSAVARSGKTVLHLDSNTYYGGTQPTFDLRQALAEWPDMIVRSGSAGDSEKRAILVDAIPQLVFARGPMVDTLMTSGVGRYLEFRTIERFFTCSPEGLEVVCSSRLVPRIRTESAITRCRVPEVMCLQTNPFLCSKREP